MNMFRPIDELWTALELFYRAATVDPLSFVLVLAGTVVFAVATGVAVVLVSGAVIDLLKDYS